MIALQLPLYDAIPIERVEQRKRARKIAKTTRTIAETISKLHAVHDELNQALYKGKPEERPAINSPTDAAAIMRGLLENLEAEELHIMVLDRRNRVMQIVRLYTGSVNSSQVRIGEIFREAIRINGTALVIAHNHPSGDPTPSPDDVAVTRGMVQAGKLLDIEVLDHIVIGTAGKWVSLKERGLGFS